MDHLEIWVKYTRKMGYGAHYGRCMADVEAGRLPPPPQLRKKEPEPDLHLAKKCRFCGKMFIPQHQNQAYCESACQMKMNQQRYRESHGIVIHQRPSPCKATRPPGGQ